MFKSLTIAALAVALVLPAAPVFANNDPPGLVSRCQTALEAMSNHIVRKETVRAIGKGAQVTVRTFCMGIGPLDFGNASGLGKTIGANPVLASALAQRGFRADDVTNINIDGNHVTLVVHRE